jgi:hypothetical protein
VSIESDNLLAAYTLSKVLKCDRELAARIINQLDELGWELREYKYNMTPERWEQMGERQVNP